MTPHRRVVAVALLWGSILGGCDRATPDDPTPPASPGLEVRPESYRDFRDRSSTRLTRRGPAPGPSTFPPAPPGAEVMAYRSGEWSFRAFASPVDHANGRKPGLLFLHGGFGLDASAWGQARGFVEAGYVAMVPALRGENGQPGDFSLFRDEVADVLAAADALARRLDVDPSRIFLAGHSVGGTLALLATLASGRFVATATFSAAPDMVESLRGREDLAPFDARSVEELRARSGVAFAPDLSTPTRLFFGDEEYWLQPSTTRLARLAQRAGHDAKAVELPGGHDSVTAESIGMAVRFFGDQPTPIGEVNPSP